MHEAEILENPPTDVARDFFAPTRKDYPVENGVIGALANTLHAKKVKGRKQSKS